MRADHSQQHPLTPHVLSVNQMTTPIVIEVEGWSMHAGAGFMSNRGRQNVASYLVLDMGVDWRRGADWFETVLQDYDVCSNWGNWVAAAGLTGGRINHFNITKQSKVSTPPVIMTCLLVRRSVRSAHDLSW